VYYLDDEATLCRLFAEMFDSDHIKVTTFQDAAEAISRCLSNPPDLIFIDYRLGHTMGDQVAEAIDDAIPRVLVTGDLSVGNSEYFKRVVHKPFRFKQMEDIIAEFCR
jgi:CheY-like chemotaxis protein